MMSNPELARAYSLYRDCREQVLFRHEFSRGQGKQAKNMVSIIAWTTGYHHLPEGGGMRDQPHKLMQYFDAFRNGDARAANEQMK